MLKKNFTDLKSLASTDLRFIIIGIITLFGLCACLRFALLCRNFDLAATLPVKDLLWSFVIGMRFDMTIISICSLPLAFLIGGKANVNRKVMKWLFWISGAIFIFAAITELEFYHEFHTRLNSLAIQYIKEDPKTVTSMLWYGFPIIRYCILAIVISALYFYIISIANNTVPKNNTRTPLVTKITVACSMIVILAFGVRGSISSGAPIRWGDAYHSQHIFANHLALNGLFTLMKSIDYTGRKDTSKEWLRMLPGDQALDTARKLIITPEDKLLQADKYPILREYNNPAVTTSSSQSAIKNIVVILMESFSAEFVGALGHNEGITPEFDKLTEQGLLFDHYFSNGTHTHQGMFNSIACFPNLPGYEYLMQQTEGSHMFSGLPSVLKQNNFNNVYVYNGSFSWDNQEGFFRNQGMTNFVGRDDFINPKYINPTWGVSDEDMFNRSLLELNELMAKGQPFFAVLQTLSNHVPYSIPSPSPVATVIKKGKPSERLTAMKYSDWALGQFFKEASKAKYFNNTLFVVIGDHGFAIDQQLTTIDLFRFHVPLLLIGPGLQEKYGKRNSRVASHLDIVPTAVSLLNKPFKHQCWGRNILDLPKNDKGFAIIKPSGNDQIVAILRGNNILIRTPDKKIELGQYSLYPASYTLTNDLALQNTMSIDIMSFIQTSMQSLLDNTSGIA